MEFKLHKLKSSLVACALTNAIANGGCYYLMNRSHAPKTLMEFVINAAATAFILSLLCSGIYFAEIGAKAKKGKLPETSYDRNDHLLVYFFPRKPAAQLFAIALYVTVVFIVISSGIYGLLGFNGIPVVPGMILHGILAGGMGLTNVYLAWVCRLTSLKEVGERSSSVA